MDHGRLESSLKFRGEEGVIIEEGGYRGRVPFNFRDDPPTCVTQGASCHSGPPLTPGGSGHKWSGRRRTVYQC